MVSENQHIASNSWSLSWWWLKFSPFFNTVSERKDSESKLIQVCAWLEVRNQGDQRTPQFLCIQKKASTNIWFIFQVKIIFKKGQSKFIFKVSKCFKVGNNRKEDNKVERPWERNHRQLWEIIQQISAKKIVKAHTRTRSFFFSGRENYTASAKIVHWSISDGPYTKFNQQRLRKRKPIACNKSQQKLWQSPIHSTTDGQTITKRVWNTQCSYTENNNSKSVLQGLPQPVGILSAHT